MKAWTAAATILVMACTHRPSPSLCDSNAILARLGKAAIADRSWNEIHPDDRTLAGFTRKISDSSQESLNGGDNCDADACTCADTYYFNSNGLNLVVIHARLRSPSSAQEFIKRLIQAVVPQDSTAIVDYDPKQPSPAVKTYQWDVTNPRPGALTVRVERDDTGSVYAWVKKVDHWN